LIDQDVVDKVDFLWLLDEYKAHFKENSGIEETDLDNLRSKVSDGFAAQYNRLWHYASAPMIPGGTNNPDLDTKAAEEVFLIATQVCHWSIIF